MPSTTLDPVLVSVVLTALQAHTPTAPTLAQAEDAVGALFAQLGPRLIEGVLQAEHEPQPRKKGGMRFVRVATACGTSGGHPAR